MGRAGRGEGEALEELARQVRPLMSAWARAACPERSEAEDVLQESILEFHRSLAGLRDGRALLPWLRRLVRNNAADSHRRRSRLREVPLEAAAGRGLPRAAAGAGLDLAERAGLLLAALGELAEEDREMLTLRHEAGLSLEEIAEAAGSSPRAVESRLFRARRALRKKLAGRIEL